MENTFVLFTSDHGFHFGQFGMHYDKRQPYEFDIRVPMLLRGPGVHQPNHRIVENVVNIDIAPTFLEMAGLEVPEYMDGESFLPFALDNLLPRCAYALLLKH